MAAVLGGGGAGAGTFWEKQERARERGSPGRIGSWLHVPRARHIHAPTVTRVTQFSLKQIKILFSLSYRSRHVSRVWHDFWPPHTCSSERATSIRRKWGQVRQLLEEGGPISHSSATPLLRSFGGGLGTILAPAPLSVRLKCVGCCFLSKFIEKLLLVVITSASTIS